MTNFNFTFQPGISSEQIIGFEMAGRIWSQYFQDDTVFNIHVSATDELPPSVVGGALPTYVTTNIETVQWLLGQDVTSIDDEIAIANLNTTSDANGDIQYSAVLNDTQYQASDLTITQANAKALGLENLVAPVDGYIVFNDLNDSSFSWSYDFSRTSASSSSQLDFLSMALHELGHIMGFISGVDVIGDITNQANLGQTSLLDLFRYSDRSAGTKAREFTPGQDVYFSIDGGQTSIAPMASGLINVFGGVEGYQASHWAYQAPDNSNLTPEVPEFDLTTALLDLINISAPVSSRDAELVGALQLSQFLVENEVDIGDQTYTTILENARQATYKSLGIMDPALVPGFRSTISTLDLQALDIIGYDLRDSTSSLNYASLLQETQTTLAQTVGVDISDLETALETSAFTQDKQIGLARAIIDNQNLFERRRSSVRTRRWTYWQEDGLDPTVVNIVSDGAGEFAQIAASAGSTQVTTVQAIPYAQLFFRSDTLLGTDASDYIWPVLPSLNTPVNIDTGDGNNLVVLGDFTARVTAAAGNDTIVGVDARDSSQAIDTSYTINAGEGNNYAFLTSESGDVRVTTGSGNDYISVGADNNIVETTGGNNQIYSYGLFGVGINNLDSLVINADVTDLSLLSTPSTHRISTGSGNDSIYLLTKDATVTTTGGNNLIHIQGTQDSNITITAGDGNDEVTLIGTGGDIDTGDGNNTITITNHLIPPEYSTDIFTVTTGEGNDIVRLNTVQANVSTGDGNDVIDLAVEQSIVNTGSGNDLIILGDRQGAYIRFGTQTLIADFSTQDTLLLYGSRQDYQLNFNTLFYQGQSLATFENGVDFTLESDRLFFTDTSLGADLADLVQAGPDLFAKPLSPLEASDDERALQERYDAFRNERPIRYSITGGDDAEWFTIDSTTGEVQFKTIPSEETPLDSDGNNIYDIVVTAILGEGQDFRDIDTQRLAIEVSTKDFSPISDSTIPKPDGKTLIEGTSANDALVGTDASERLVGFAGIDQLTGGGGADVFVLGDETGSFYADGGYQDFADILDFNESEDTIVLSGSLADYRFSVEGSSTWIFKGDDLVADVFNTAGQDLTSRTVFADDDAPSSEGDDEGQQDDDNDDDDVSAEPKTLIKGTSANDALVGTDASERLVGFAGIDQLTGGGGADVFVLGDETGSFYADSGYQDFADILDFNESEDTIVLSGSLADYRFSVEGSSTWIFKGDDLVADVFNTAGQDLTSRTVFADDDAPSSEGDDEGQQDDDNEGQQDDDNEGQQDDDVSAEPKTLIEGTSANDALVGTDASERLVGFAGIDQLTGGGGADVFVLGDETGSFYADGGYQDFADILDFNETEDTIVLSGSLADYRFSVEGSSTWIFKGDDLVSDVFNTADQDLTGRIEFLG